MKFDAKELFEKRWDDLRKYVREDDLSQAPFPLMGDEARIHLRAQLDTLTWVLEMM